MLKIIRISLTVAMVSLALIGASALAATNAPTTTDDLAEAKTLINQGVSCQQLSQEQLDKVGDYYMEQMMPGAAHKNMEQILGGEGSESLKQMHILMAHRWYCGDAVGMGMMGMMGGFGPGMMRGGWNAAGGANYPYGMMGDFSNFNRSRGYGMMGYYGSGSAWGWGSGILMAASVILLAVAIAALTKYLLRK